MITSPFTEKETEDRQVRLLSQGALTTSSLPGREGGVPHPTQYEMAKHRTSGTGRMRLTAIH